MKRRRFIQIVAAGVAGLSLPRLAGESLPGGLREYSWNGYLMGAEGGFRLYGDNAQHAQATIDRCFQEIRRLEAIFSLYDSHSTLSGLNREGRLRQPPAELLAVLNACRETYAETEGAFDPTVQPLWRLYADHFAAQPDCAKGPSDEAIAECLDRVGFQHVQLEEREIRFARPGMALTLNGVAQGYITDRVTEILREAGFGNVIVELGETRALGARPGGKPWRIGVLEAKRRDRMLHEVVELDNQALATSGGYGSPFDQAGRFHHLLDPRTGRPSREHASVSVVAPTALRADALSTGLSILSRDAVKAFNARHPNLRILSQA